MYIFDAGIFYPIIEIRWYMDKLKEITDSINKEQIENIKDLQYYYPEYENLIKSSTPLLNKTIKIYIYEEKFLFDLDFNIIIESDCGKSEIWVASSINDVNRLWRFLESLTFDKSEYCYYVDEEGPNTFLYIKPINHNDIRVLHISDRRQVSPAIEFDDVKILQDFIINKKNFINSLYKELLRIISNSNEDEADEYKFGDFERLNKDSQIIKRYLSV